MYLGLNGDNEVRDDIKIIMIRKNIVSKKVENLA